MKKHENGGLKSLQNTPFPILTPRILGSWGTLFWGPKQSILTIFWSKSDDFHDFSGFPILTPRILGSKSDFLADFEHFPGGGPGNRKRAVLIWRAKLPEVWPGGGYFRPPGV